MMHQTTRLQKRRNMFQPSRTLTTASQASGFSETGLQERFAGFPIRGLVRVCRIFEAPGGPARPLGGNAWHASEAFLGGFWEPLKRLGGPGRPLGGPWEVPGRPLGGPCGRPAAVPCFVFCVLGFVFCVLCFVFCVLGFVFCVLGFGFGFWVLCFVFLFCVLCFVFCVLGFVFCVLGFGFCRQTFLGGSLPGGTESP